MNKILATVLILAAAVSCLEQKFYEDKEVLSMDSSAIEIPSEKEIPEEESAADQNIYDTVYVTSNRPFSASLQPEEDWISLVESECINLSGRTQTVPVVIVCSRNRKDVPRSTTLVISGEGSKISVPVTQKAPVYYLTAQLDKERVLGVRDTCLVKVRSNTKWTARLDDTETTALATITKIAGRDNGSLQVCFGLNLDFENTKDAVVVLEGEGCEPRRLKITQNDGSPFVTFLEKDFREAPESHYIPISVTANVPWTISVENTSFVKGKIITEESYKAYSTAPSKWVEVSGGDYVEGLNLAYIGEHGGDPTVDKSVTLVASTVDGTSTSRITVQQHGCIHLDFLDIEPTAAGSAEPFKSCYGEETWPFSYPNYTEMCFTWNGCMLDPVRYPFDGHLYGEVIVQLKCGYTMPIRTNGYEDDLGATMGGGFWYQTKNKGLQLSYCINGYDYLKTPIVPGMALKRLIFEASPFGVNTAYVRECGGSDDPKEVPDFVPNAKQWKYVNANTAYVEHEPGYTFEHVFENPEKEKSYRLSFEQTKCCSSIKELVFIYE